MRAVAIEQFGGLDGLEVTDLIRPKASKAEIVVRVVAAGVNPVDWKICRGDLQEMLPHRFPLVPGWDVAGVVEEIGENATRFRKGDRVWAYARKPTVQWGCYAEYVALPEASVALMPAKLLFEEAAAVPLAALTAYQALFSGTAVAPGRSVLIHGAGGGVGHFAVQLAKGAGAKVYATAGPGKRSFVSSLGADGVIDYTRDDFVDALRRLDESGVDLVLDTIGGDTLSRSFLAVADGGSLVSIVEEPRVSTDRRDVKTGFLFVEPDAEQLRKLGGMVDRKQLRPHVQKIYPLAEAAEALGVSMEGHVQGKLVLAL